MHFVFLRKVSTRFNTNSGVPSKSDPSGTWHSDGPPWSPYPGRNWQILDVGFLPVGTTRFPFLTFMLALTPSPFRMQDPSKIMFWNVDDGIFILTLRSSIKYSLSLCRNLCGLHSKTLPSIPIPIYVVALCVPVFFFFSSCSFTFSLGIAIVVPVYIHPPIFLATSWSRFRLVFVPFLPLLLSVAKALQDRTVHISLWQKDKT